MPNVLPAGPVLSHDPGNPLGTLAELFDVNWYLAHTDDPAARRNPLGHYLLAGTAQGLNPHPLFHTAWYLATYPDVAASGINPFAHYVANGARDLRNPCRLFDAKWYAERYPDVPADHGNALKHYCTHGAREGRDPHPLFNTRWYLDTYRRRSSTVSIRYPIFSITENRQAMPQAPRSTRNGTSCATPIWFTGPTAC